MTRRPARAPIPIHKPPPDPELSRHAHALLDRVLADHPETTAILIAVDSGDGVQAASIPHAWSVKRGMIDILHETIHGDDET